MRPLIAGNWKRHGLSEQLGEIEAIAAAVTSSHPPADVLICAPATLVARAAHVAAGRIAIGGEDCSPNIEGAFTGDISAEMLRDAGASAVIVGHSERRLLHGETNAIVAAKAEAARRAGLMTIICIGETASQRAAGQTFSVCDEQIARSVPGGMNSAMTAIAHEPLWAIGTGRTPTPQEISDVQGHIRETLLAHSLWRVGQARECETYSGAAERRWRADWRREFARQAVHRHHRRRRLNGERRGRVPGHGVAGRQRSSMRQRPC